MKCDNQYVSAIKIAENMSLICVELTTGRQTKFWKFLADQSYADLSLILLPTKNIVKKSLKQMSEDEMN